MGTNWLGGLGVHPANLYAAIQDRLPRVNMRNLKFVDAVYSPYYRRNMYNFTYRTPDNEIVKLQDYMNEFPSDEFIGALLLLMYDGQRSTRECPHGYDWEWCPTCSH